jgi:hypothetical protein
MAAANMSEFFRRLLRGMAAQTLGEHSDQQLVERPLTGREEAAFQAIVNRHGPMVYRVNRTIASIEPAAIAASQFSEPENQVTIPNPRAVPGHHWGPRQC